MWDIRYSRTILTVHFRLSTFNFKNWPLLGDCIIIYLVFDCCFVYAFIKKNCAIYQVLILTDRNSIARIAAGNGAYFALHVIYPLNLKNDSPGYNNSIKTPFPSFCPFKQFHKTKNVGLTRPPKYREMLQPLKIVLRFQTLFLLKLFLKAILQ